MRKLLGERWEKTNLLSEYGRQRLIGYAESFGAIAQSLYGGDKLVKSADMDMPEPESFYSTDNAAGQNMDRQDAVEWSVPSRQSVYYRTCLENNRHLLADNLREMAGVMKQVAGEVFACRPFPVRRERRVVQMFKAEGITVRDLYYIEDREDKSRIGITMAAESGRESVRKKRRTCFPCCSMKGWCHPSTAPVSSITACAILCLWKKPGLWF